MTKTNSVTLERLTYEVKSFLHEKKLDLIIEPKVYYHSLFDGLVVSLQQRVHAEVIHKGEVPLHYKVPTSWWQMLKRDVLRRPFKQKEIVEWFSIKEYFKYPEFRPSLPNEPFVLEVQVEKEFEDAE